MYAVIETGGKQYKVAPGEVLKIEKLNTDVGSDVKFDKVLMASTESGLKIGTPTVDGATVTAEVIEHGKDKKVIVFKKKRRKGYKVKRGHRQHFTTVAIKAIEA